MVHRGTSFNSFSLGFIETPLRQSRGGKILMQWIEKTASAKIRLLG
jgi:hypothetical protein